METLPISDGMVEKKYDRTLIVLNTLNITGSSPNKFTMKLSSPLRDVVAIKLLGIEIRPANNNSLFTGEVFVNINDYYNTTVPYNINGQQYERKTFANFYVEGPGLVFNNRDLATTLSLDPYTYIFDPIQSSLDRFDIQITNNAGALYDTLGRPVKIVLAVYTKRHKFSRV